MPNKSTLTVLLAVGILERRGAFLLVASRYANHREPIWTLPGGRLRHGELLRDTVRREFSEEVGLAVEVGDLRYVAESYDRATGTHFVASAFDVAARGEPHANLSDAHVVAAAWIARADLARYLTVAVVREPLVRHLAEPARRYFGFEDAGITIEFADSS